MYNTSVLESSEDKVVNKSNNGRRWASTGSSKILQVVPSGRQVLLDHSENTHPIKNKKLKQQIEGENGLLLLSFYWLICCNNDVLLDLVLRDNKNTKYSKT